MPRRPHHRLRQIANALRVGGLGGERPLQLRLHPLTCLRLGYRTD